MKPNPAFTEYLNRAIFALDQTNDTAERTMALAQVAQAIALNEIAEELYEIRHILLSS